MIGLSFSNFSVRPIRLFNFCQLNSDWTAPKRKLRLISRSSGLTNTIRPIDFIGSEHWKETFWVRNLLEFPSWKFQPLLSCSFGHQIWTISISIELSGSRIAEQQVFKLWGQWIQKFRFDCNSFSAYRVDDLRQASCNKTLLFDDFVSSSLSLTFIHCHC